VSNYQHRDTVNGILLLAKHLPEQYRRDLAGALLAKLPVTEIAQAIVDHVGDSISVPAAIEEARNAVA
jgi:hypothetical protein